MANFGKAWLNAGGLFARRKPRVSISAPNISGATIAVSALVATLSLHNTGGAIASTSTAWGDGTTNGSLTHAYASPGVYAVAVSATNAGGTGTGSATAYVSVVSLLVASDRAAGRLKQDAAKTVPAVANGDPVRVETDQSVDWTATADSNRMTLTDLGSGKWGLAGNGSSACLASSSPVTASGELSLYAAFVAGGASQTAIIFGGSGSSQAFVGNYSNGPTLYFSIDADTNVFTGITWNVGANTIRLRRDAADVVYLVVNGGGEAALGTLAGNLTLDVFGGRSAGPLPSHTNAGVAIAGAIAAVGHVSTAQDTNLAAIVAALV